jgi:hypothetical protein
MQLKKIGIAAFLCISLAACTKNNDYDPTVVATGSLNVTTLGECKDIIIHGDYGKGIVFNTENYLDVFLTTTEPGSYNIATNTVNGVVFSGAGRLGAGGPNRVRLYGSGTPAADGSFPFKISFSGRLCTAYITFGPGATNATAVYTFGGAPGVCTTTNLLGMYAAGSVIGTGMNSAIMQVNVTAIGRYQITTNTVNGINFTGSGSFLTLGQQSVALQASGLPLISGLTNFAVNGANTSCSFNVAVQ